MGIRFTKMHSLGNDFMVIDAIRQTIHLTPAKIQAWSDRYRGIGFDQCLVVEASQEPDVDFFYRIFNANGHEVGQCGNGARCLARFLQQQALTHKKIIHVATQTTRMTLHINQDETVTVDFGKPQLIPSKIPLKVDSQQSTYLIPIKDHIQHVHALSVGNPHAIIPVKDILTAEVALLGQAVSEHPLFPEQTNVGFMQIVDKNHIKLRVYERDCGETEACGSGAVAAVAAGRLFYHLEETVCVQMQGGALTVTWPNTKDVIYLTGPAEFVYEGTESLCVS